ncbi:hypothetical protein Zm00014a_016369 [Zea mays]|uniref:Uncharacterized protein n=2 Tax=Zea mays TaxID=4577 RepID=A0A3L6DEQ2_MAIZE|nr:hypothetical protein Zm00014a_016369 [Zea mays]PWZ06978.1 hypothetical protein Zm00014a_016369 [Zea mays]PWZ06979.1 hypothetical protein Zm00014a_016369 [Zea mays]
MSHFHPTQHASDNDFQMWQQQMMFKHLQEFQRQQQLQQSDHGARMQPSFGQFHAPAKPLPGDQLSTMSNEMVNNETMNSGWPHNFTGGDLSLTSNSQMLNNGSTNWDQIVGSPVVGNFMNGSMFVNAHNQSMRPMGLATHQVDQTFYPMHATSSRGPGNQYSQFLGIPADPQSEAARVGPVQSEKTSRPFNSSMNELGLHMQGTTSLMHNFRGKGGFLNNSLMQSQGDNIRAGSPVTMNQLQHGFQTQDFHGRPNQVDLQAGMQEKSAMQVGQASRGASLDPTEEKILFGSDEDSNWGALLRGDNDNVNSLDNDNYGGGYSSLQSGSWSALMQEALQSTTSESPKEEWSGLSFHKTEQVMASNANLSGRNGSKFTGLSGANLENARPSPASSYADGTMNNPNLASFQHVIRPPSERRDHMSHESSNAPVNNHQSTSEVNKGYFQQGIKQIHSDARQGQAHLVNGTWPHQKTELLRSNLQSTGVHATPPGGHGFGMSQQIATDHNINRESSNNQNDWKANNALGQDMCNSQNIFNSNENSWKSTGGDANSVQRFQQRRSDVSATNESSDGKNISMMSSSMPMMTQDHYQMVTSQSGEQIGMNRNLTHRAPETSESPGKSAEQRPGDFNQEYLNAIPNERETHISNHGRHITSDSAPRRHSVSAGKESENLGQSSQQAMGSYILQNRAMGSSGMNIGLSPGNPMSNSLFPPQTRNSLQHHFGTNSHVSNSMPSASEKMMMAQEQLQSRHGLPNSSSASTLGGADTGLSQNRAVQNSQHMLQLLHKVDNSRNSNVVADIPNNSLGVVSAQQQLNHSSLQGFGLRLAPPSQLQSISGNLWSSQTNADGKQFYQDGDRTQLPSTPSQSLTPQHQNSLSSPFHSSETENTGQPIACFPQLGSGQQYPMADDRSGPAPMLQQQPQQSNSATVFKNVWTNISAQRLTGMQPNKITPNIIQSMMFPNNAAASNLWSSQKADDQGQRASTPSDIATSSANSQNQSPKQAADSDAKLASSQKGNLELTGTTVTGGNESLQKPSSDENSINAVSSFAQLRQQGILGAKHGENPGANFQAMNVSHNNANHSGGIVLHGSPAPTNIQQQNYSLLHQMQTSRHMDVDPGSLSGKTTKPDIGSDAAQIDWNSGQRFAHVTNNSTKSSADNIGSPGVPGSFTSDLKMLSFASRNEERNPNIPSRFPSGECPSPGMITTQDDNQNQVQHMGTGAMSNSDERSERPRINPQMAPSWFGHYGNYRNGQSVATLNAATLNAQKPMALPFNFPKASRNNENNSHAENRVEPSQSVRPGHHLPSARMEALVPSNVKVSSMMRRPKKRKTMDCTLVSWHKIIESPRKLRGISTPEMDWAWAANRLIEKDEAETPDDAPLNYLPRKRLILTSQLIQQLLPAIPATILRAQAVSAYGSATYTLSMLTLRDACSMASSSYNSCSPVEDENNPSEQPSAKKMEDRVSKVVEVFVGRIRKMENDFISLNKRASMLDVQLECQDLERISIVNRLGRFHGRSHAAAVESSSAPEMTPRRIFPERHVMSFAVPGNLPEGVCCLSL